MAIVSATICVRSKNFTHIITPTRSQDFSLKLMRSKLYDIALDQSSSCTGIAICSVDNDIGIIIEIKRDTNDKAAFYRAVKGILYSIVKDMTIRYIVCEDPPPVKGKRFSSTVLLELRGRVDEWVDSIEELRNAEFSSIFPQTWKSLIVDKSKGKNRSNDKRCIAEDICDIYPEFNKYMNVYSSKDYDGFDAMGILLGYRKYAYTEEGIRLICGKMEKRHHSFVGYRYIPVEEVLNGTLHNFMSKAVQNEFKFKYLQYNDRYNKFENIRMATSNNDCCYTLMPNEVLDVLKWEFDLEPKEDHVLVAYLFNQNRYPQATRTALKYYFPMNEEVTTC